MATKKPTRGSRKKLVLIPILVIGVAAVYVPVIKSTLFKPEKVVLDELELPTEDEDEEIAAPARSSRAASRPVIPVASASTGASPTEERNEMSLAFGSLTSEEESDPGPPTRVLNGFLDFGGTLLAIVDGRVVAAGDRLGDTVVERIVPGKVFLRDDGQAVVLQLASSRPATTESPTDGGNE